MTRFIIDVREPSEFAEGHVVNAVNIPMSEIIYSDDPLKDTPKDTEIILYCRSGARSGVCADCLKRFGFTNVTNGINKATIESTY